jgi:hypothetical protein
VTPGYISILIHASCISNPTLESCNIWVNSRVPRLSATECPGHNADKLAANKQRAASITLAGVFTSERKTCTDHVLSDCVEKVIITDTSWTGYDVYFDRLELWRKCCTTWRESSPATDYSKGTSRGFCGGQRNWLNSWSVGEWRRYLKWNTKLLRCSTRKTGVLPGMICAIINHWMFSTQPPTVCVLQSFVPLIVYKGNT